MVGWGAGSSYEAPLESQLPASRPGALPLTPTSLKEWIRPKPVSKFFRVTTSYNARVCKDLGCKKLT